MTVRVERDGPVTVVTIDRPAVRNAVDGPTAAALADAFRDFATDDDALVAVLTGAGGVFCSGADLTAMTRGRGNAVSTEGDGPMGPTRMLLDKPVLAAVEGHAVAGGLELALWCDLRVAGESARFGCLERRWGVPLIDGGTYRLPRIVGLGRALDLILTGREVGCAEAASMGLVDRVVPDGTALAAAVELAEHIASFPWRCVVNDRHAVYDGLGMGLEAALANEDVLGRDTIFAPGFADGVARFTGAPSEPEVPGM